jgi:hypothetical protein
MAAPPKISPGPTEAPAPTSEPTPETAAKPERWIPANQNVALWRRLPRWLLDLLRRAR